MKKVYISMGFIFCLYILTIIIPIQNPKTVNMGSAFLSMSHEHLLGTDQFGRDIMSLMIYGFNRTVSVLLAAVAISMIFGLILGICSGYFGGVVEIFARLFSDISMIIPSFVLALIATAKFGANPITIGIVLGVCDIGIYSNQAEALTKKLKDSEYIQAAQLLCMPKSKILFRHVFPKVVGPALTLMGGKAGSIVLAYASLTFIGLGTDTSAPDWGTMLYQYRTYLIDRPILLLWPSLGILLLALIFYYAFDNFNMSRSREELLYE